MLCSEGFGSEVLFRCREVLLGLIATSFDFCSNFLSRDSMLIHPTVFGTFFEECRVGDVSESKVFPLNAEFTFILDSLDSLFE